MESNGAKDGVEPRMEVYVSVWIIVNSTKSLNLTHIRCEELLDQIGNAEYITTLDLAKGLEDHCIYQL